MFTDVNQLCISIFKAAHSRCAPINIYIDILNKYICFVFQAANRVEIIFRLGNIARVLTSQT